MPAFKMTSNSILKMLSIHKDQKQSFWKLYWILPSYTGNGSAERTGEMTTVQTLLQQA